VNQNGNHLIEMRELTRTYQLGPQTSSRCAASISSSITASTWPIMGPSGSGKSTLMNIVGCLDRPSAGNYILDAFRSSR